MDDQLLENVTVEMEPEVEGWSEDFSVPEPSIEFGKSGSAFVAFNRPADSFASGSIPCTLKFDVKDVDSQTGDVSEVGIEDQYQLEDIEMTEAEFMSPAGHKIGFLEFKRNWETIGGDLEAVKKYSLGVDSLQAGVDAVMKLLGMSACEGSNEGAIFTRNFSIFFVPYSLFVISARRRTFSRGQLGWCLDRG